MPNATSVAKSGRLTTEAETILQSFFAIQDVLSKEEAVVLAEQVQLNCCSTKLCTDTASHCTRDEDSLHHSWTTSQQLTCVPAALQGHL